ncbi:MAG: helix-turn-helix domain-containing protein [Candidatus Omnitrophica bacterium]|nr:helix-turn-helix domain-containing protein [Candidatus Omnitrophota bacterium]
MKWNLLGVGPCLQTLVYESGGEQKKVSVRPIYTVVDVCHRLRKSRRQVYRYMRSGRLKPCAQILGQWLFSKRELEHFEQGRMPVWLKSLFWDARISDLSVGHHSDFILARAFEYGDRKALRWVFRTYPISTITRFLDGRGRDVLSTRTWHFWALQTDLHRRRSKVRK